jgi:Mn-dependent DtxR family transcriptional regulator
MIIDSSKINFNEFVEETKFKELSARDVLRSLISTLYNNPTKAAVFLVTDFYPKTSQELQLEVNHYIFGCPSFSLREQIRELKELGIKSVLPITIKSYFDNSIIKLSSLAEKVRIKRETGLAEKKIWGYKKTLDGAIIGDLLAYECIMASSDPNIKASNYLILGVANTRGETDSQVDTLLLILYLYENKIYKPTPLYEIVSEMFEYKGTASSEEYSKLLNRISERVAKRLIQAGLINYDVFKGRIRYRSLVKKEEIEEKVLESIKELRKGYSLTSISNYRCYAKRILEYVAQNPGASSKEISDHLKISYHIPEVLSMLRYAKLVEIIEGRPRKETALINITEEGKYYVEKHVKPILELLGVYDVFKDGVNYPSLSKIVRPDLESIYEERNKRIDSLKDAKNLYEFQRRAREVRIRHQNESGSILRYSK